MRDIQSLTDIIHALLNLAIKAQDSTDVLKFTQAALNVAHVRNLLAQNDK